MADFIWLAEPGASHPHALNLDKVREIDFKGEGDQLSASITYHRGESGDAIAIQGAAAKLLLDAVTARASSRK